MAKGGTEFTDFLKEDEQFLDWGSSWITCFFSPHHASWISVNSGCYLGTLNILASCSWGFFN
jgi:hypothetical protein